MEDTEDTEDSTDNTEGSEGSEGTEDSTDNAEGSEGTEESVLFSHSGAPSRHRSWGREQPGDPESMEGEE